MSGPTTDAGDWFDRPEQSCDCRKLVLVLEVGDTHASAHCGHCNHDVWIGRSIPEGPALSRGTRPRKPGEDSSGVVQPEGMTSDLAEAEPDR